MILLRFDFKAAQGFTTITKGWDETWPWLNGLPDGAPYRYKLGGIGFGKSWGKRGLQMQLNAANIA